MAVQTRSYPVVYGGWLGGLIAVLVIITVLVLWLTNQLDAKTALLIGFTNLAVLLR